MRVSLSARRVAVLFTAIVTCLVLVHVILQVVRFSTDDHTLMGLLAFFSLGADANFPTFYSAVAILCCSGLLAIIAVAEADHGRSRQLHWFGLSIIFAFLSMDEMLAIHERLEEPMRAILGSDGALYYAWVVPYAIASVLIGAAFVPFLLRLPRRTALQFVFAGSLYVGGAIGFETIGGFYAAEIGTQSIPYAIAQTIEEIMEMAGIVVFLYALTSYAEEHLDAIEFRLAATDDKRSRERARHEPAGQTASRGAALRSGR